MDDPLDEMAAAVGDGTNPVFGSVDSAGRRGCYV